MSIKKTKYDKRIKICGNILKYCVRKTESQAYQKDRNDYITSENESESKST